jgi:Tfp pilus assembly protein PilO
MNEQQRQALVATVILGLLAAGGSIYFYHGFMKEKIEAEEKKIRTLSDDIKKIESELRRYEEFLEQREQVEQIVKTIADATTRLPTDKDDRRYLEKMRDFIAKTGVKMNSLERLEPATYADWVEFPQLLSGDTRYLDFVQFLALAEQNVDYFMRVKDLDIKNDPKTNNPTIHPFTLTLSSFVFKE